MASSRPELWAKVFAFVSSFSALAVGLVTAQSNLVLASFAILAWMSQLLSTGLAVVAGMIDPPEVSSWNHALVLIFLYLGSAVNFIGLLLYLASVPLENITAIFFVPTLLFFGALATISFRAQLD